MTSCSWRNAPGRYSAEVRRNEQFIDTIVDPLFATPVEVRQAGYGLLGGRMHPSQLSHNPIDILNQLQGVGANCLYAPRPTVDPQLRSLTTVDIFTPTTCTLPRPLVVDRTQRAAW
jgi:hypothetical protein